MSKNRLRELCERNHWGVGTTIEQKDEHGVGNRISPRHITHTHPVYITAIGEEMILGRFVLPDGSLTWERTFDLFNGSWRTAKEQFIPKGKQP